MAVTSTIIAGVSLATGFQQQKQAQKQQKKAANAARKAENIKATQARKQSIREANIKRAQIVANTTASGLAGSSGAQGGISSIGSQLEGNFSTSQALSQQYAIQSNATQKATQFASNASTFNDIGSLAFQFGPQIDSKASGIFGNEFENGQSGQGGIPFGGFANATGVPFSG